jgi:hypothetical protein
MDDGTDESAPDGTTDGVRHNKLVLNTALSIERLDSGVDMESGASPSSHPSSPARFSVTPVENALATKGQPRVSRTSADGSVVASMRNTSDDPDHDDRNMLDSQDDEGERQESRIRKVPVSFGKVPEIVLPAGQCYINMAGSGAPRKASSDCYYVHAPRSRKSSMEAFYYTPHMSRKNKMSVVSIMSHASTTSDRTLGGDTLETLPHADHYMEMHSTDGPAASDIRHRPSIFELRQDSRVSVFACFAIIGIGRESSFTVVVMFC